MRKLIALCFLLMSCDDNLLLPANKCGVDCAVHEGGVLLNEDARAVTCRPSKSVCNEDKEVSCPGYEPPANREYCGGFDDDDCNPKTLESAITIFYGSPDNDCSDQFLGKCRKANKICVNGDMVCDPRPSAEVCDRSFEDEDCDGLINEDDPSMVLSLPQYAYYGDEDTINVGVCRAGFAKCEYGEEKYIGMILPSQETCGNDIDDDCDGYIDEPSTPGEQRAFLLALDYSGSMSFYIEQVKIALCNWSDTRSTDLFGVAGFGVRGTGSRLEYEELIPFSTAEDACYALMTLNPLDGSNEYAAEAVLIFQDSNPWPINNKNVIIFTDENYQESQPGIMDEMLDDCVMQGYSLGLYTLPESAGSYYPITNRCNSWIEYLSQSAVEMQETLARRFAGSCE